MRFSGDGRYLALGSTKGHVSVWALGDQQYSVVRDVLEKMQSTRDFWYNYPIYLPDHKIITQPPARKDAHYSDSLAREPLVTLVNNQPSYLQTRSDPTPYLRSTQKDQAPKKADKVPATAEALYTPASPTREALHVSQQKDKAPTTAEALYALSPTKKTTGQDVQV